MSNDKELFEKFYQLRVELNKAYRNIFSEYDIVMQAFEDYQNSDSPRDMIMLFQVYLTNLDLEDGYIDDLIANLKTFSDNNYYYELADKANFVEVELTNVIKAVDNSVNEVSYEYSKRDEYVVITYKNSFVRRVCVTADSKRAIVSEVMRELH